MANLKVISGYDAASILQQIAPALDKAELSIHNKMIAAYRNPESSADVFFGLAAELAAIDNLRAELRTSIRLANEAQRKDIAHATQSH